MKICPFVAFCIASLLALSATAQTPTERRNAPLVATQMQPGEKIIIDGKLDDAVWQRIAPMTDFFEYRPRDSVAAKYPTDARVAYDKQALYVALTAHDPDISKLDAPLVRRDQVSGSQDLFALHIDPVGSRKFAQIFRVNAAGAIGDGLFNEDTTNEDFSPDFEFEVRTSTFKNEKGGGWIAEFRIPFSTLRYSDPPSPTWSIQIVRGISRDEQYRFANGKLPRDSNCFLCYAQALEGMRDLPAGREFTLTPQLTLRRTADKTNNAASEQQNNFVAGLDVKFRPRPDLVFDATINPDFSQVELDTPQLATNAQFALFFREKRPFFLEGADILSSPFNGAIYTRSINDPAWGARLTGRNETSDYTFLTVRDDGKGFILLPGPLNTGFAPQETKSQATIGRYRTNVGNWSLGALVTDRTYETAPGKPAVSGNPAAPGKPAAYSRVAGVDFVWRPQAELRVRGQLLGSFTHDPRNLREVPDNDRAALVDYNWRDPQWNFAGGIEQVGKGFRADNGFFSQAGYLNAYQEFQRKFSEIGPFVEIAPYVNIARKTDEDGRLLYEQIVPGVYMSAAKNTNIGIELRKHVRVRFRNDGEALRRDQFFMSIESAPGTWLSRFYIETAIGERADIAANKIRRGYYIGANANFRLSDRFEIEPRIDESIMGTKILATASERALHERAVQLTGVYHLSARDSVRLIGQYNRVKRGAAYYTVPVSASEKTETLSLVYGHLRSLGTSLHVGVNTTRNIEPAVQFKRRQDEVFVKVSWAFDVAALLL